MGFCITRVVVISIWREVADNFGSLRKISPRRKARAHVYLKARNYTAFVVLGVCTAFIFNMT